MLLLIRRTNFQGKTILNTKRVLRDSLLSLAGLLAFASVAVASTPTLEPGTDRLGGDYKGFALDQPDPQVCRDACANDAACKSYSYVKPGVKGAQAMCFLKNSTPPPRPNDCCSSGAKPTLAFVPGIAMAAAGATAPKLKTLVQGSATAAKLPPLKIPSDLMPQQRMELTGGVDGDLLVRLAPNHMFEPGRGLMHFINPSVVWGGNGGATDPMGVKFGANSDDEAAELNMRLQAGAKALLLVDCKVSAYNKGTVYVVSELLGPEQTFNSSQLVDEHLLFLVNTGGTSFVKITADDTWTFYGCEVRKL